MSWADPDRRDAAEWRVVADIVAAPPVPDLIDALSGLHGLTICVRHDLSPASMRLMGTLGVRVIVDPRAQPCANWQAHNGGCPLCRKIERLAA